jgi:uncharacterized damage-inducible protein DinB
VSAAGETFGALSRLLTEMAHAIAQLTRAEFAESGVSGVSGSIGGHVRHCLDHVLTFERGLETGLVDYDTRRRQTTVEGDRELAVLSLTAAATRLERHTGLALGQPLVVRSVLSRGGPTMEYRSSVARELAFVISHTIHHGAQIALLAHRIGAGRLPDRFGVAPATPDLAGAA